MCRSASAAREALRRIGLVMNRLGLRLHPTKTRMVDLRRGKESFVFLGCTIRKRRSTQRNPRWHFMQRWPSPKATKKLRDRVRELTSKRQCGQEVQQIVAKLTPALRGWANYFQKGNESGGRCCAPSIYSRLKTLRRPTSALLLSAATLGLLCVSFRVFVELPFTVL